MKTRTIVVAMALLFAASAVRAEDEYTRAVFFGKKFADLREWSAAYEQFAKADALRPDQPAVLYNMAVLLAKSGRFGEAQGKVDRYTQLYPTGAEKALVAKLQLELDFERELQKKRRADQAYVEVFDRAKYFYAQNDLQSALRVFQEAEQQRPADAAVIFNEAVILEHLGELVTANKQFHRYLELETDADLRSAAQQRVFAIENAIEDMKTKIVCPFCGFRLPSGARWCPHCWHRTACGPASATRATYFADGRFARNETLSCPLDNEAVRYSPAKQRRIQAARKAEGWTYDGDVIQSWSDKDGNAIRYMQGADYLETIVSPSSGDILRYSAHAAAGVWLLDREDMLIGGQRYTIRRTFDALRHVSHEAIEYQNTSACGHIIGMTADYSYQNDTLVAARFSGGYDGYEAEGSPRVEWQGSVAYAYDGAGRETKEELTITSFTKTYRQKPYGALRDDIATLYSTMRPNRAIENLSRIGDLCASAGTTRLGNRIDLRPFYAVSPNLAMELPFGVTRAVVTFTY